MDGGYEQRVAIKFCFKAGLSATQTTVLVQKADGNQTFLGGILNFKMEGSWRKMTRGGCPKSTRTEVNIAAVVDLVKNDRQIASRMIAESFNIPKTVVLRILKRGFGKEKAVYMFCSTLLDT
jgi:hypothetical protein